MHKYRLTIEKIKAQLERIKPYVNEKQKSLEAFKVMFTNENLIGNNVDDRDWKEIQQGEYWGGLRKEFVLRTSFNVPRNWSNNVSFMLKIGNSKSLEALSFLYGPEALVYIDGELCCGLDPNRQRIDIPEKYLDGENHLLALAGWTGIKDELYEMELPKIVAVNESMQTFIYKVEVVLDVLNSIGDGHYGYGPMLTTLNEIFVMLPNYKEDKEKFYLSIEQGIKSIDEKVIKIGLSDEVTVYACGHGHLDLAWLWTINQTKKKGARTFSNVLRLMDKYPEFYFSQSQPQLYKFIESNYPEIFEKIANRIEEGRWEPMGGMWVEADCNITGAESLARQFLLGRQYYDEKFDGKDSRVVWLPDTFGFPWQMPQLMKQAGINYFATAKLSWNQYNRMPYDSFWWQGLDGTSTLTQLVTTSKPGWWGATYSADLTVDEINATWKKTQNKELNNCLLIPYGIGDGGGGPTEEMVEKAQIMKDFPHLPKVKTAKVIDFFEDMTEEKKNKLPVWNDELYFELHRGTYTSQAMIKYNNRLCERILHNGEFLATMAMKKAGLGYPHEKFNELWKLLCLNQFHDIIPGSSIEDVYVDSMKDYKKILEDGNQICLDALSTLESILPKHTDLIIVNPTSFNRCGAMYVEDIEDNYDLVTFDNELIDIQYLSEGAVINLPDIPSYGYLVLQKVERSFDQRKDESSKSNVDIISNINKSEGVVVSEGLHSHIMENNLIRLEINEKANIVSMYDKEFNREIVADNCSINELKVYEDYPLDWDAWDIDIFYDEKSVEAKCRTIDIIEDGKLYGCIQIESSIYSSKIIQKIELYHDSKQVDFSTTVYWNERNRLLKAEFPVDIISPKATYDIQWGNIERNTHNNTTWDISQFESCGHKWVDLSEGNYGVSILNDSKYGHHVKDNIMSITLLRSSTFPDPKADMGTHHFKYSIYPHEGDWRLSTARKAYELNYPVILHHVEKPSEDNGNDKYSFVQVDNNNMIVETIKCAENEEAIIVRAYENNRTRGPVNLSIDTSIEKAIESNILEEELDNLSVNDNSIKFNIKPYEIKTLKVK
jgi:alpha-mannosidase